MKILNLSLEFSPNNPMILDNKVQSHRFIIDDLKTNPLNNFNCIGTKGQGSIFSIFPIPSFRVITLILNILKSTILIILTLLAQREGVTILNILLGILKMSNFQNQA